MKNKNNFSIPIVIFFLVVIFFLFKDTKRVELTTEAIRQSEAGVVKTYLGIGGSKIRLDFADTSEEQQRGLSGRKELGKDEGMLFTFQELGEYAFWMKDMNFAIDIIWLDEEWRVVHVERNVLPESYPTTFVSNQKAKYVLEVFSGFSDKNNLKIGDKATLFAF